MRSGVARKPIEGPDTYRYQLSARLDPSAHLLQRITASVRANPKRVVFAEGEEESVIRAAAAFQHSRAWQGDAGRPRGDHPQRLAPRRLEDAGLRNPRAPFRERGAPYIDSFTTSAAPRRALSRLRAHGDQRPQRLRGVDAAAGDADAMVTGVTRSYSVALNDVRLVLDSPRGQRPIGVTVIFTKGRVVFVADTSVHEMPTSEELADIAMQAAGARAAIRFRAARGTARLLDLRLPAQRTERTHRGSGAYPRSRAESISNMTAKSAADVALDPRRWPLSVLPAYRHRQCPHHAGDPLRVHLDQAAAADRRRHGVGTAAGGP